MKKTLILIIPFFSIFIFSQTKSNFEIFGKINGLNNSYIYFSYEGVGKERVWDSLKIQNNKFFFKGFITESKNGFITTLKNNRVSDLDNPKITERIFIDPNSVINIELDYKNFHTAKISGSKSQNDYSILQKKLKETADYEKTLKTYLEQNYNSYVGLYYLKNEYRMFSVGKLRSFYDNLTVENKKSEYGISLLNALTKLELSVSGQPANDFESVGYNGEKIKFSNFKGKYVLVDFWASWCKPCREKNPELIKLYDKYKSEGFTIIGIADDLNTEKQWRKAIVKDKIFMWPQLNDKLISDQYAVSFLPTQFLINREGIIIHRYDDINEPFDNLKTDLEKIFKK